MIFLLLLCVALAELETNADYRYCESAKDVASLINQSELPPAEKIETFTSIAIYEERGLILLSVLVPYLAYDVHYTVDFVGRRYRKQQFEKLDRCSTEYRHKQKADADLFIDSSAESEWQKNDHDDVNDLSFDSSLSAVNESSNQWSHARNAKYTNALSSLNNFTAYYVDPRSRWKPYAQGCSHVSYETWLRISDCIGMFDLHAATNSDNSVHRIGGTVHITLTKAPKGEVHMHRMTSFELYVDRSNNKVLLTSERTEDFSLAMHSVEISAVSKTTQQLVASLRELTSNTTKIVSITNIGPSRNLVLKQYPSKHDHINLVTQSETDTFDTTFAIDFLTGAEKQSRAHLTLMIAAPRKIDIAATPLSVETQRISGAKATKLATVANGSEICMLTYITGHELVTRLLQIELLEAQVCSNAKSDSTHDTRKCTTIYDIDKPHLAATQERQVKLIQPGTTGPSSVIVCFVAHTRLTDDKTLLTVDRDEQRYRVSARFLAANARSHYILDVNKTNDMYNALNDFLRPPEHTVTITNDVQFVFSSGAKFEGVTQRTFRIVPRKEDQFLDGRAPIRLSQAQTNFALIWVAAIVLCAFAIVCFIGRDRYNKLGE